MNSSGLVFGFIDTKRHAGWAAWDQTALGKAQEHRSDCAGAERCTGIIISVHKHTHSTTLVIPDKFSSTLGAADP